MARGTKAAWLVGAGLLTSWAVSSASDKRAAPPPAAAAAEAPMPPASRAVAAEVGRLRSRRPVAAAVRPSVRRDPFAFGGARASSRASAVGAADSTEDAAREPVGAPQAAAIDPVPALAGIATVRGRGAVAVVSFEGALYYAARGEVIANRYRVDEIVDRSVDVFDLLLGTKSRLILQRP